MFLGQTCNQLVRSIIVRQQNKEGKLVLILSKKSSRLNGTKGKHGILFERYIFEMNNVEYVAGIAYNFFLFISSKE